MGFLFSGRDNLAGNAAGDNFDVRSPILPETGLASVLGLSVRTESAARNRLIYVIERGFHRGQGQRLRGRVLFKKSWSADVEQ